MVSVVIHAGCYKTATSTIQAIAQKNRERFLADFGVLYPATGARANQGIADADSIAHHLLFHAAKSASVAGADDSSFTTNRTKLIAEARKSRAARVFVSTELLSFAPEPIKDRFLRYCEGLSDDVTIVYAVRRPDEMIDSMNNQMLRAGRGRTRSRDLVDYRADIEQWHARLGVGRVKVLYFAKNRYEGYIRRMFGAVGVDVARPGVITEVYANAPMSVTGHVVRTMIFDRLKAGNVEIDRALRHELNLALAPIEAAVAASPKLVTLGHDDRVRILERNREDLEAIKPWLSEDDREALEAEFRQGLEGPHPPSNLDAPASLGKDDLAAIYRGLVASPFLRGLLAKD
ncbi:MAG: hypothetical protein KDK07_13540 [Bauldia sp.]|nr:hypothetical protein [Bauldia sp.]